MFSTPSMLQSTNFTLEMNKIDEEDSLEQNGNEKTQ
jgi:hypothetical protein